MPMILRSGKICLPPDAWHSTSRRRGSTFPTCKKQDCSEADTRSASPSTINRSLPERRVQFQAGSELQTVHWYTDGEWFQIKGENRITAAHLRKLRSSPDPRDHVLFCYHGEKRVFCRDFRTLSGSQGLTAFQRLVNGLLYAAVLCLLWLLLAGPVVMDWYAFHGDAGFAQLRQWCSRVLTEGSWSGGNANRARQCHLKRRLRGFGGAAPMIPLVNQLGQQLIQSTSRTIFNVRKRSSGEKVVRDWEALGQLQRDCALPVPTGKTAGSTRGYELPATVQNGNVVIQIPRVMSLSSLTAPAYLRTACKVSQQAAGSAISWLWGRNSTRPCSSDELLAFSLLVEKHLQRQSLREYQEANAGTGTHQNDLTLPPHPYCLVKSNRKNAPFFSSRQWEAVRLVTHLSREPIDNFEKNMRTIIQQAPGAQSGADLQGEGKRDIATVLQTIGDDCDEGFLDLDIKDAISVVYSKTVPDGAQNEAVFPAALEFEAGLDTYTWDTRARLALIVDDDGFKRIAVGDSLAGSAVSVNKGELNNIHLLHRFGITEPNNPWGTVFFLRNGTPGNAAIASSVREGVVSEEVRPLFTIREAEENLPDWVLKKKTIRRSGTLCFHSNAADPETPHVACPRLITDRLTRAPVSKDERIIWKTPLGGRESVDSRLKNSQLVCDYKTLFTSKIFGYRAFSLNKHEPIGGFQKEQYLCVRAMLTQGPLDTAETDPTDGSIRVLAAAEIRAADFFMETCSRQLQNLTKAANLIQPTQKPRGEENASYSSYTARIPGSTREENLLFLGGESEQEELQRSLEINGMMLDAMHAEEALLRHCVSYFTDVRRRASRWQ